VSAKGKTWSVRSAGKLIEGFDQQAVIESFSSAFNITEDKAIPYLKKGKLIRKGLNEVEATNYKTQLEKLGLMINAQDSAAENPSTPEATIPKTNTGIPGLVPTGMESQTNAPASASFASSSQPLPQVQAGSGKNRPMQWLRDHL